jgi:hypothetical protein
MKRNRDKFPNSTFEYKRKDGSTVFVKEKDVVESMLQPLDWSKDNTTLALQTGLSRVTIWRRRKLEAPKTNKKHGWAWRGRRFC